MSGVCFSFCCLPVYFLYDELRVLHGGGGGGEGGGEGGEEEEGEEESERE